ncbi:hypothetical protein CEK28_10160 [Xenophilus sp. AP218F]|nr:VOC family protein [Chromobacterium sp. ASV5]OWY39224.1 hypothetical protein CEK28_10160 [Xenophilus sp. AP218F]
MQLNCYLHFNGNAEAALSFYLKALGGRLVLLQRFSDGAQEVPPEFRHHIMHAGLEFDGNILMLSDTMQSASGHGRQVSLSLNLSRDEEDRARELFIALAEGGMVEMPLLPAFWGALLGSVVDRFGVHWLIHCEQ